jgi:hypothetical protein
MCRSVRALRSAFASPSLLGVAMTVQRQDPLPLRARSNHPAPVVDVAALDDFLSGRWRIATRAVTDPADWQRMHQEAGQLKSGTRPAGPTLAEVLGRRGVQL